MSRVNQGGSAFPLIRTEPREDRGDLYPDTYSVGGMTLRDWFASQALVGLLASRPHDCDENGLSNDAYLHADAMLRARERSS